MSILARGFVLVVAVAPEGGAAGFTLGIVEGAAGGELIDDEDGADAGGARACTEAGVDFALIVGAFNKGIVLKDLTLFVDS